MGNRRIALGLGTSAGALLGAALLSGLTSPLAAADTYTIEPVNPTDLISGNDGLGAFETLTGDATTNPYDITTLPAFGGLGTDTTESELIANIDTSGPTADPDSFADVSGATTQAGGAVGTETEVINTYSNPLFTDTSSEITEVCGTDGCETLAQADAVGSTGATEAANGILAGNLGATDDQIWFAPGGTDILGYDTASQDLLTPLGDFSLADLGGSELSSLFSGGDLSSLFSGGDLSSLFSGGDLLAGFDPLSLLGSI
jgi:hypothetical protein